MYLYYFRPFANNQTETKSEEKIVSENTLSTVDEVSTLKVLLAIERERNRKIKNTVHNMKKLLFVESAANETPMGIIPDSTSRNDISVNNETLPPSHQNVNNSNLRSVEVGLHRLSSVGVNVGRGI